MPAINVNMYVPVIPPPAPVEPLWTQDGTFANAVPLTHNVPSGYSANTNISNPYYIKSNSIEQDGSVIIYVPNNGTIQQFYLPRIGGVEWDLFSPQTDTYFATGTYVDNGITYTTYTYYDFDFAGPVAGEAIFSFSIT